MVGMSSHRTQTKKFLVIIGVDRPLEHVFATILVESGAPAKGFKAFAHFPMDQNGVNEAVATVETFVGKSEHGWTLPQIVKQALADDLEILESGGDIGSLHIYNSPND